MLAEGLLSKDKITSLFCEKILEFKKYPMVSAYIDLIQFQRKEYIEGLDNAMENWMKQKDVNIKFKAEILITKIGSGKKIF